MASYKITRKSSGATMGIYEGTDEMAALQAMVADGGEPGADIDQGHWIVEEVPTRQLKALRDEARQNGDREMLELAEAALDDDVEALDECLRVIADVHSREPGRYAV